MKEISVVKGIVAPMDRANVDTDMIIPKQFLKSIKRSGFGQNLFDELRYLDQGEPDQDCTSRPLNPEFVLNQPCYEGASILLARQNFGCGSSREHAPWALEDYGFRCIIAPSFADIFFSNCLKNGILTIALIEEDVDQLFEALYENEGYQLIIDLPMQEITTSEGNTIGFEIDAFSKHCLLNGLDDIDIILQDTDAIRSFEGQWRSQSPWLFDVVQ